MEAVAALLSSVFSAYSVDLLRAVPRRSGGGFDGGDDFFGGVGEVVGADDGEAAGGEGLFAGGDVVAFEADDEGDFEGGLAGGGDDAIGDDVAIHDAAEDVDEDALHV